MEELIDFIDHNGLGFSTTICECREWQWSKQGCTVLVRTDFEKVKNWTRPIESQKTHTCSPS